MSERMYQGIIGVLVLIILVGGAVMIGSRNSEESAVLNPSATSTASAGDEGVVGANSASGGTQGTSATQQSIPTQAATVTSGSDSITVQDQPAGMTVDVASVTISKRGWVAVRQNGHYLGAQFLRPGTYKNVAVALLKGTEAGGAYEAVLFYDNGNTQFDWNGDTVVTRADGSDIAAAFLAK